MRCEDARNLLSDHLNGAVAADIALALETHLEACAACRGVYAELRWVSELLHGVEPIAPPADLGDRIHAALAALDDDAEDGPTTRVSCGEAQDYFFGYQEGDLDDWEDQALRGHLHGCSDCRRALEQLDAVKALLKAIPRESLPAGLEDRIRANLIQPSSAGQAPVLVRAARWLQLGGWRAIALNAVAIAALFFYWHNQAGTLPRIETAAVSPNTNVAVNIGFEVATRVDGVTYQIDLPDGLQFIDDHGRPLAARSVAWKGSLEQGQTVVPILVRGLRPGRYEIQAFVNKGTMRQKTTIVLPVTG